MFVLRSRPLRLHRVWLGVLTAAAVVLIGAALGGCTRPRQPQAPATGPAAVSDAAGAPSAEPPSPRSSEEATASQAERGEEGEGVQWLHSLDEAKAKAGAEGKPLLIDFYTVYCPPCKTFKEEIVPSPEVSRYADSFVWATIDCEQDPEAAERFQVEAVPTIVIMKADGEIVRRLVGVQGLPDINRAIAEFVAVLEEAQRSE